MIQSRLQYLFATIFLTIPCFAFAAPTISMSPRNTIMSVVSASKTDWNLREEIQLFVSVYLPVDAHGYQIRIFSDDKMLLKDGMILNVAGSAIDLLLRNKAPVRQQSLQMLKYKIPAVDIGIGKHTIKVTGAGNDASLSLQIHR